MWPFNLFRKKKPAPRRIDRVTAAPVRLSAVSPPADDDFPVNLALSLSMYEAMKPKPEERSGWTDSGSYVYPSDSLTGSSSSYDSSPSCDTSSSSYDSGSSSSSDSSSSCSSD